MEFPGFVNGSGELATVNVDAERTVNLYPEVIDAGTPKVRAWLRPTPGLTPFATGLGAGPVRAVFYQDGRMFCVSGDRFYEIFSDGTSTQRGVVNGSDRPAFIVSNGATGNQLFIVSASGGYIFALNTNTFTTIAAAGFPASCLAGFWADLYFLAVHSGAPQFSFSALSNGLSWSASDVAQKQQSTDNLVAAVLYNKELWLQGSKTTEIWYNSGNAQTPWTPQPVVVESGSAAGDSLAKVGGSLCWLQGSDSGSRAVVMNRGYQAVPIGSEAVHAAIKSYSRVDDAIGWSYELDPGHPRYVLSFPTAEATWVYDLKTGLWHEWLYWNAVDGVYEHHLGRCHTYAWNKNLVGSRVDGTIYQLSATTYTDDGDTIRRLRRAPHVFKSNKWIYHNRLELVMETGVGVLVGQGTDPQMFLRYSNNGGKTWGSERWASLGPYEQFGRRVYWQRLGRSRNRVYEVVTSDPAFVGIFGAEIDIEEGLDG